MNLTDVRCAKCSAPAAIPVAPDVPLRDELEGKHCPSCGAASTLRLVPRPRPIRAAVWREPHRIGPHDEPPDERDEAEDVELRRRWREERTQ